MKKKLSIVIIAVLLVLTLVVGLAGCNKDNDEKSIRFVVTDGTPALSIARLFNDNKTILDYKMDYDIIPASLLMPEMVGNKADILIAPSNAGAMQIVQNKVGYKLAAVSVEGNLHVVARPSEVGGSEVIALNQMKGKKVALIGQGGVPARLFGYILAQNNIEIGTGADKIEVIYVNEAPSAKIMLEKGSVQFALVGEPAATAFGIKNGETGGFTARLDLNSEYKKLQPDGVVAQASLFVSNEIANNVEFMSQLKVALESSVDWVYKNPNDITSYMREFGSVSTFVPASIERCNIKADFINDGNQQSVLDFIKLMGVVDADESIFI